MLNKTLLIGCLGVVAVIAGFGGCVYYQSNVIDKLTAENEAKALIIEQQQAVNQELITNIEIERQAIEEQQKIANEFKKQNEVVRERVKKVLIKEPCGSVAMPNSVLDDIDRLHKQGNYKD